MGKRKTIFFVLMLLAAGVWTWRYQQVNRFYDAHTLQEIVFCQIGDELDFSGQKADSQGYILTADAYEVVNFSDYIQDNKISLESRSAMYPDKLVLVRTTIKNVKSEQSLILTDLELHTEDTNLPLDFELFDLINADQEQSLIMSLEQGQKVTLTIPFMLLKNEFKAKTWRKITESTFYFRVPNGPKSQYVKLSR